MRLWAWLGLYAGVLVAARLLLDPDLARERLKMRQKTADPVVLALLRALFVIQTLVGLLDVARFHWSDTVPPALSAAAFVITAGAFAFIIWSIRVNRFFVPGMRIQPERGHRVVEAGPYRYVRHPGYVGMSLVATFSMLALGSWLGFGLGLVIAAVFAFRAGREDRFLRQNLEGYADYAGRTRYRLIPGIW